MEVEWACEQFSDPSAVVLPMHGKLSSEEQSSVFQNYPGKRKIIFCTNIAETSLTIKDIKYVVDSGMVKESRFEAASGMNVLKVVKTSQSSANQRAGRAGRTRSGKCFRLYSEHDYLAMKKHQEPEIHKVHLGIAVLRIISLGINNVQDFEFVDSPCPKTIDIAIKNLLHLGAIICKNNAFELTDSGWNLVKLGIEPRLGKIILDCFDRGLRKEGLVLASVMANSSSIFCRVGSEEDKFKADRLRIPFCHPDGDLFTLLSVYKRWEAERSNKNMWCWQNSINAKSMRRCQETVSELESCLRHELNIIIPSYWFWNPDECNEYNKSLKKVILLSLCDNVAMYSGNDSIGYEVALTGKHFQLHPSSSLLMYAQKPDWVVFGEILSLSNQYLVCVTAVDYESIFMIQPPLFDVQQLESRKMQLHAITGLGNNLLKRLSGKSNHNLQRIISLSRQVCSDDNVNISIDFDKNEIHIYAGAKNMDDVTLVVQDALDYEAKLLRDECFEKKLFPSRPGSSSSIALFGAGAEIKHLELEMRYLTVEIFHPNSHTLHDKELLMMVEKCVSGIANYCKYTSSTQEGAELGKWGRITFLTPAIAEKAVSKLNEMEFCGAMLEVLPVRVCDQKNLPFPAVRTKVCWPRKPSKGLAFISCAPGEAEIIARDCFSLGINNMYVNCQVSEKNPNCLFVKGIPRDASEAEIYDAIQGSTNKKILDVHLLRGPHAVNNSIDTCREALIQEISVFMPKKKFSDEHFRVEVFDPEPKDYMMKAAITFDGTLHLEAAKALGHIEGKVLRGCYSWQRIQFQQEFHSSVSFPSRVYLVIKNELDALLESFKCEKGVVYKLEQNLNGSYRVKISANATKTIADLRRPLEDLMKGKIISHPDFTPAVLQLLLSRDGISIMHAVERDTGAYILYDRHNLNVKVFGPSKNVSLATEKLVSSLVSLHERRQLEVRLRGRCLPPNLMKEVVQRFGSDLQGLNEIVPGAEITLNARRHALYISGSMELKERVESIIYDVAQSIDQNGIIDRPLESSCPICLCEPEKPYILEACGHRFCQNCLIEQCESAIRSHEGFPLRCSKEGCKNLILVVDLRTILSPEKLEELFRASLGAFVASSGGAYRYCPSPDCPSVYRVRAQDEEAHPFACGACFVETCTKCHLEYHPLISCERYKEYKEDPDRSLDEWCSGKKNIRKCPFCGQTIEKIDGCNHVTCRCGVHICWLCAEAFETSGECYSHLRGVHGSQ